MTPTVTDSTVMGPDSPTEIRGGSMPPSWDGVSKPYRFYLEELKNWKDFTTLKAERLAPAVIMCLSGEPQRLALTIDREKRKTAKGFDLLLEKFEEVFSSTEEQDLYFFYKELRKYKRTDHQNISEFIGGFISRADKLKACKEVAIPDKLLAMMMIDHAALTHKQETNLFGASGGELDFTKVSRALKLVMKEQGQAEYGSKTSPPAYMSGGTRKTNERNRAAGRKFCRYCKKRGHLVEECWKLQNKEKKTGKAGGYEFPVFFGPESSLVNPIVDSAAGTSLIGEETLKEYCELLRVGPLKEAAPMLGYHRFGYYGEEVRTLRSVYIPLPIDGYNVTVRTDVLSGKHPFLLGADTQERMGGNLNYAKRTLLIKLGSEVININLIKPDHHLLLSMPGEGSNFITTGSNVADIDFKKLHINTGHSSFENLQKLLQHAGLWTSACKDPLLSVISDCDSCLTSEGPIAAPILDIKHVEPVFNIEMELDVVYFHGRPFLHCECKKTKMSATVQLKNREATTLWNSFVYSWIFASAHGPPDILQGDPEFDNQVFRSRSEKWGIKLQITAAKAKWQQGLIERGNGILRAIFNKIDKERPELPLDMKIAHAAFSKCILFGTKSASSYELVYRRTFPIAGRFEGLPSSILQAYTRSVARRKICAALHSRSRKFPTFKKKGYLYFYRKNFGGYVGPAKIVELDDRGNMKVQYRGKLYSVSKDMARSIQQPLDYWIDEEAPSDEILEGAGVQDQENSHSHGLTLRLRNYRPGDHRPEATIAPAPTQEQQEVPKRNTESEGPAAGTRSRTNEGTEFKSLSYVTDLKVFYANDGLAGEKDIRNAFRDELGSWEEECVFQAVPKSSVPKGSNVISSHVVYRWKDKNTPRARVKARIVPHGNRDQDRELLRTDSPSMKPEVLRLLCSFAVDMQYEVRAMDIKTAFLQTGTLERDVYMIPPEEANDKENLWKLLKTAYGLVDGPIRWYKHSRDVLLNYGFIQSSVDPTLYIMKGEGDNPHRMIVATQVDDFLYTGKDDQVAKFEKYIKENYKVGQTSCENFVFNGVRIIHDFIGRSIFLTQPEVKNLTGIVLDRSRAKMTESEATSIELNHFRSITGSLLWFGTQTVPHLLYLASSLARKVQELKVKHLKGANSNLKSGTSLEARIRIARSDVKNSRLLVFTDASHGTDGGVHSQEGCIIFKYDTGTGNLVPLLWSSRKIKRVVKSTLAAEAIAAVDGYDDAVYIQYLMNEVYQRKFDIGLYLDSKSLFDLMTSTHLVETTEKRLKIDISIFREAFEHGDLNSVSWIPRKVQLADCLTKGNREAAELLQRTFNEGRLLTDLSQAVTRIST